MMRGVFPSSAFVACVLSAVLIKYGSLPYLGGFGTCLSNNQIHFQDFIPKYIFQKYYSVFLFEKMIFLIILALKKIIYLTCAKVAKVLCFFKVFSFTL
jgi:hypothetical protein